MTSTTLLKAGVDGTSLLSSQLILFFTTPMRFLLLSIPDKSKRTVFPERGVIILLVSLGTIIVYQKNHQTSPCIVKETTILPSNISSMWSELHALLIGLSPTWFLKYQRKYPTEILYVPPESLKLHCIDHSKQRTKAYFNFSKKSNVHCGTIIKINV